MAVVALLSFQSCQKQNDEVGLSSVPVRFETVVTRSAELTTSTISSFNVVAFLDDAEATPFMSHEVVTRSSFNWTYGPEKFWPKNDAVHFFAYSSSTGKGTMSKPVFEKISNDKFQGTFEYNLPLPEESLKRDAESQPDIVFAQQVALTEQDGKVNFSFSHALTAIQFKVGTVPPNTTLERIDFVNVHSKGECTVIGDLNNNISFSWVPDESTHVTYSQKFPSLPLTEGATVSLKSQETTFMMIPQTFDEHARIRFVFTINGEEYIKDVLDLKDIHPSWNANEIHTYTITLN